MRAGAPHAGPSPAYPPRATRPNPTSSSSSSAYATAFCISPRIITIIIHLPKMHQTPAAATARCAACLGCCCTRPGAAEMMAAEQRRPDSVAPSIESM